MWQFNMSIYFQVFRIQNNCAKSKTIYFFETLKSFRIPYPILSLNAVEIFDWVTTDIRDYDKKGLGPNIFLNILENISSTPLKIQCFPMIYTLIRLYQRC